jgi:hypothetical protein
MALIITPAEIAAATNLSTTEQDVQIAQDLIELFAGADLATLFPESRFTALDLRRLRFAVQWQTLYLTAHPDLLTRETVKRAAANGASIEYDGDNILAPLAKRFLKGCTFLAGGGDFSINTLRPSLAVVRTQPDPWVRMG